MPCFFTLVEFILSISPSNEVIEQYFCKQNLNSHWHLSNTFLEPEFHVSQLCPSSFRKWLGRTRKNKDGLELTVIILVHTSLSSFNYIFEHGLILVFSFTYVNTVSIQGECFYVYRWWNYLYNKCINFYRNFNIPAFCGVRFVLRTC